MGEAGIFHPDDRVELIRGRVVHMSPIGRRHAGCVTYLTNALIALLGPRGLVSPQNPVVLDRHAEPQPDLAVLKPRTGCYRDAHPAPQDVWLLIEVADTTLEYDRAEKLPLYAEAGIAEVWLVNLPADAVEVHRQPRDGRYPGARTARRGETVSPLAFPDVRLRVEDILG
jgi:Uma2 family endonuclease